MASKSIDWDELLLTNDPKKKEIEVSFKKIDGDGFIISKGKEPGTPGGIEEDANGDNNGNDDDGDGSDDGGNEGESVGPGDGQPIDPDPGDNPCIGPDGCPDLNGSGYLNTIDSNPSIMYRETGPGARTPVTPFIDEGDGGALIGGTLRSKFYQEDQIPEVDGGHPSFRAKRMLNAYGQYNQYHEVGGFGTEAYTADAITTQFKATDPKQQQWADLLGYAPENDPCIQDYVTTQSINPQYVVPSKLFAVGGLEESGPWRNADNDNVPKTGTVMVEQTSDGAWTIAFHYEGGNKTMDGATFSSVFCENRVQIETSTTEQIAATTGVLFRLEGNEFLYDEAVTNGAGEEAIEAVRPKLKLETYNGLKYSIPIKTGWNVIDISHQTTYSAGVRQTSSSFWARAASTTTQWQIGGLGGISIADNAGGQSLSEFTVWDYAPKSHPRYQEQSVNSWGSMTPLTNASNFTLARGLSGLSSINFSSASLQGVGVPVGEFIKETLPGVWEAPDYCERVPT